MKKLLAILFIFVLISIFAYYLNEDKLNKISTSENDIAFLYEMDNGNYEPGSVDKWNDGYALNVEKSSCDDEDEILNWDSNTNEVLLTTDKPTKCTLWFDQKEYVLLSGYPIEGKDVTLTNILGEDGDFENVEAWNADTDDKQRISCQLESNIKQHGNYSCKIQGDSLYVETLVHSTNTYPMKVSHKYYIRISGYKNNNNGEGIQIYWPIEEPGNIPLSNEAFINGNINVWETFSSVFEPPQDVKTDSNYTLRLDNNNNYENVDIYFDEFMLIDLTASYNSNIPSQDELDKELIYFDETVDMKKTKGKEGVFQASGAPDNAEIECNNGGKATVSNSQVTITGGAPITTCYLKKSSTT